MRFGAIVGLIAFATVFAPALADVRDFYGNWAGPESDAGGIARIVVTPGDGATATIHLFGRCPAGECDWGTVPARLYSDDPGSTDVRLLAADFDTPAGHKRLTLRLAVGHALRFEVQTDFADGRTAYGSSGNAAFAGDWNGAPRVAQSAPPVTGDNGAPPTPSPSRGGGMFGDSGFIGIGPRTPDGYVAAQGEDCTPFDPGQTRVAPVDGNWRLGDFSHRLVNFGPHHEAALRLLAVIGFYHFDEACYLHRDGMTMLYWKRAGAVPKNAMPGQDCVALDPAAARTEQRDGAWRVMSGNTVLLDYGEDGEAAAAALSVIRTYRLNRQCFVGRPDSAAQYWLAQ